MSAPIIRPNPLRRQRQNHNRVVALEQVPRLGMGVELSVNPAGFEGSTIYIDNWTVVNDPHGYYDLGTAAAMTEITIPEGLGGIYIVSIAFEVTAE